MTKLTKTDWQPWNEEQERFRSLETQGLVNDLETLEAHIQKLLEVAPKDSAGWPHTTSLDIITLLRKDVIRAKAFFGQMP